jgi:hypothetical protein
MSLTYLFLNDEGVIEGFDRIEADVFTSENDAEEWRRNRQNVMAEANETERKRCMRSRFEHKSIEPDDLEEFEREFAVECEVTLTYYKTFTVTAKNETEAEDLARDEADDHSFLSYESPDEIECVIENVTEA